MRQIDSVYDEPIIKRNWGASLDSTIHKNDREDKETIGKVQDIFASSLPGKVEQNVVNKVENSSQIEANYLFRICDLIGKLLVQLQRISQKDHSQIEKLKTEYKKLTYESASLQRSLGRTNLMWSFLSLGGALLMMAENPVDKECAKICAEQVFPKVGEMFGSSKQSDLNKMSSLAQLLLQEYQSKSSKGQSDSSNKQEIIQLLKEAFNGLSQAARSS